MSGQERVQAAPADEHPPEDPEVRVTAHQSSPGRIVFTEQGNNDGWISTDLTVSLER